MSILQKKLTYCTSCLMPHTRPRITFQPDGECNACYWAKEKKTINWKERWQKLESLCDKYRNKNQDHFDVIVPYSGGIANKVSIPVIASGGAGRFDHFIRAYKECNISAASTSDLFNFMGDGLSECRKEIISNGIPMAKWDINFFKHNIENDQ